MSNHPDKLAAQVCLFSFLGVPVLLFLVWLLERTGWLN